MDRRPNERRMLGQRWPSALDQIGRRRRNSTGRHKRLAVTIIYMLSNVKDRFETDAGTVNPSNRRQGTAWSLGFEHLQTSVRQFRSPVRLGVGDALSTATRSTRRGFGTGRRREDSVTDKPNLGSRWPFSQARRWRAGDGSTRCGCTSGHERACRRFGRRRSSPLRSFMLCSARTSALEQERMPGRGRRTHLCLARMTAQTHPAVTEPDMGAFTITVTPLTGRLHAPVELIGSPGAKSAGRKPRRGFPALAHDRLA